MATDDGLNEYERQRLDNIARNRSMFEDLGLDTMAMGLRGSAVVVSVKRVRSSFDTPTPMKRSRRLAGEPGPEFSHPTDDVTEFTERKLRARDAIEGQRVAPKDASEWDPNVNYSHVIWTGKKFGTESTDFTIPAEVHIPLVLLSIGVTVLHIGHIVTGEKRHMYWTQKGTLFKHPYPVGYEAIKDHFHRRFYMKIESSEEGPVFNVRCEDGPTFTGSSPPWTEMCKLYARSKTRVSGPLFFGFSDPIIVRMIEQLPGYETWESVREYIREMRAQKRAEQEQIVDEVLCGASETE